MAASTPAPPPAGKPPGGSSRSSVRKQQYLILYNLASMVLWFSVLVRVVLLNYFVGYSHIYGGVGDFTKWTQTLAALEIIHSATGKSRYLPDCHA